jgi:hypothetical protein
MIVAGTAPYDAVTAIGVVSTALASNAPVGRSGLPDAAISATETVAPAATAPDPSHTNAAVICVSAGTGADAGVAKNTAAGWL